jgi:hypothetical protein
VVESRLKLEWYLAPSLMFCYTSLYHFTTKFTLFVFTYKMKPSKPSLPIPELERISCGEGFVAK